MSGTSLDGVDVAHIQFRIKTRNGPFMLLKETIRIIQGKHTKTAVDFSETELEELNHEYTSFLLPLFLVS
jgi:anhydro-N-acetylmuramic acid kinase